MSSVTFAGLSLEKPRIFGIINVTPDSFSDGGDALALEDALRRGKAMLDAGADILDVGGESTRPGAAPVGIEDEIARAVPVVRGLSDLGAKVSIDTRHAPVMEAAIEAGATIINDVTALSHDPDSLDLAVASGLPVILMHMQGDPGTMQDNPQYEDAAQDVFDYLKQRVAECEAAGMDRSRIAIDPGIGFGKTLDHNLDILARLNLYRDFKCPVLLGVSRKTFIGKLGGDAAPKERLGGSLAAVLAAAARGVRLFRVHDVAETRQALTIWQAIEKK
ncbi:MAG TPA: dihydropteroate synthase [Rhodospirillales bacterium]|jgi:dihydropteroate synthase|nr:MAG: Dihydropteroate synthase [Alphaproteobacteria bacterium MarineAlpha3_Bin2]HIM76535.1 dihydropteroate synthase [Rhodospirillales bacterium]